MTSPQPAAALPFTLRQLECFVAVAELGSITAAAATLRASDSTISDAISAMERSMGTKILHRQRARGASLTSDGLAILPIARRMLTDGATLTAAVGRGQSALVGPVRVGFTGTLVSLILPRLILAAERNHPGLHIEYRIGDLPTLTAAVEAAEIDLIYTFDIEVPPEYQRRVLDTTEAVLVVSKEHRLAGAVSARLEQVQDEPMVLLDITASRMHTLELMSSRGITPRIALRTDDYELCRSMVGRGLGYTMLMNRDISPITWDGSEVSIVPISPPPRPVNILVSWPEAPIPPRVQAVIELSTSIGAMIASSK